MTNEMKLKVVNEIIHQGGQFPSAAKQAVSLGISAAQLSRIKKGDIDKVLSNPNWISIARKLGVRAKGEKKWNTAKTPVFKFIYAQLEVCQAESLSGIFCDISDVGKTHAAEIYAKNNINAVYIDCAQTKTKQDFVRKIARELGVGYTGKYSEVYGDLVYYIRSIDNPIIILDEAGDLHYPAFLELKALWNATERACGWYLLGADGLKPKIEKNKNNKKIGYTELFSRFGSRYQRVSPIGKADLGSFKRKQLSLVVKANSKGADMQKIFASTGGSLRRVYTELNKPTAKAVASN